MLRWWLFEVLAFVLLVKGVTGSGILVGSSLRKDERNMKTNEKELVKGPWIPHIPPSKQDFFLKLR